MENEYIPYLKLALRELERFSVPGLGTFVRESAKAQIDTIKNEIYPPEDKIRIEPGEKYERKLRELLADRLKLDLQSAENLAQGLGKSIVKSLQNRNTIEIQDVGRIILRGNGNYEFESASKDPSLQAYGLGPVAMPAFVPVAKTIAIPLIETLKKEEVTTEKKPSDKVINKKKEKQLTIILSVSLAVLLLILLAFLFSDNLRGLLSANNNSTQQNTPATTTGGNGEKSESALITPSNSAAVDNSIPKVAFYIIPEATSYDLEKEANEQANAWKKDGFDAKVIFSDADKQYRVCLFSSTERKAVKLKMKELQPKIDGNPWILTQPVK